MKAPTKEQITAAINAIDDNPDAPIFAVQLEELKAAAPDVAESEDGREGYKLGLQAAWEVLKQIL